MEFNEKISIEASANKVWEVLTENKYVQQYMFNCKINSDWKVNSDLIYYIDNEGKRMDMVLGVIKEIEAPKILHHTLFPAGASYPNVPENHIYVIYSIIEREGFCELVIKQGGFETVVEGEKRYNESKGGWDIILPQIKKIAEA